VSSAINRRLDLFRIWDLRRLHVDWSARDSRAGPTGGNRNTRGTKKVTKSARRTLLNGFCAFCVCFVPLVFLPRFRWAKLFPASNVLLLAANVVVLSTDIADPRGPIGRAAIYAEAAKAGIPNHQPLAVSRLCARLRRWNLCRLGRHGQTEYASSCAGRRYSSVRNC
jgi:hypothetical protein